MPKIKDYSIKLKLIVIFIIFKVVPLLFVAFIGVESFLSIDEMLKRSSDDIIAQSKQSVKNTTYLAIDNSIKALDTKSKQAIEDKSVMIANNIAEFLYHRDEDLLFLASLSPSQKLYEQFFKTQKRSIIVPQEYIYDDEKGWIPKRKTAVIADVEHTTLKDNQTEFHKVPKYTIKKKLIPIYKEITFFLPNGKEIYKVSTIDKRLKNIAKKENTYLHAEEYFFHAKKLKKGEIYVSPVIGEYVASPIIGSFTKEKAKKAGIAFEPQKYGYAGIENPIGKKFEGIVRFVTPVYQKEKLLGYVTLALDHHHIMDFTDFVDPLSPKMLPISDASHGNYAFMWNNNFECISHPRDYFIIGYDKEKGRKVPGWIDTELAAAFQKSEIKDLGKFLETQPWFLNQSLQKKPNLAQLKKGEVGLDCRYLNFAPQCQGWSELVGDGGYGSFVIFWSNVWKLTVAATIPYYTGDYGKTARGFGFVTIGANVAEFHKAATQTKKEVDALLTQEYQHLEEKIGSISKKIYSKITQQIQHITIVTFILIIVVIYVAIWISNYIAKQIESIIIGTKKLKEKEFDYKIEYNAKDEFGELVDSFNEMASSIKTLKKDLEHKIYTDELTLLPNRYALTQHLETLEVATLFVIDIDSFKNLNDFYGIENGNKVLFAFAKNLQKFVESKDIYVYRIGSDDYAMLLERKLSKEEIEALIKEFHQFVIHRPMWIDKDFEIQLSFTCGVAVGKKHLIEKADLALNEAKKRKKLFMLYDKTDTDMNKHAEFLLLKDKITYAIEHDNVIAFFQPIYDVKNPQNKKYEVLMRIKDHENYLVPNLFMEIAKESKLYLDLTRIIIKKAFERFSGTDVVFSVNLSIVDITDPATVEYIINMVRQYQVGKQLVIEILESEEITDFDILLEFISRVREYGVRIAIDDFGSGYSNFSYFSMLQPDFLKIDGSLIKNIRHNSTEYHVVEAIVKFAKALDIKLIAEYVSTKEIYEVLQDFDIDFMQGYYFGEPREELNDA